MKKHILGFTIFAFIVGSFISVFALLGYFTQTIPNVPKVESDALPVFAADKRTSCSKRQRKNTSYENTSYELVDSYYFADEKKLVSTVKVKWNGLGIAPEKVLISPKYFSGTKEVTNFGSGESRGVTFNNFNREIYMSVNTTVSLSKNDLKENIYADIDLSTGSENQIIKEKMPRRYQVIVVHGDSSIIGR